VYHSTLAPTELLAAVAAWTSRIRVGTSVLVAGYHRPVELAQRLATLDLLSGGRLDVGIGAGWSIDEHALLGVEPASRSDRMEELVEALLACWGNDPVSFHGTFFDIPESIVRPKPLQQPRPKLLAGTASEIGRSMASRLFDGWNPVAIPAAAVRRQLDEMNHDRPAGLRPLTAHLRLFAQPPLTGRGGTVPGLDGIADSIVDAVEMHLDEVIVDCNFWVEMDSPSMWCDLPNRLAARLGPLLTGSFGN
jgi:probable F420-dependent oxidoreductase